MSSYTWTPTKISDFVTPSENNEVLNPDKVYPILGMSLEGRGLFLREKKAGLDIGSKTLNRVIPGEFIYSRLFAWKGAFDFVKDEFRDCYVSDEYPTFIVDETKADVRFLNYYFNQSKIWKIVESYCIGVTKASRNRFKEQYFLNMTVPLPSYSEQVRIVSKIETARRNFEQIERLRDEQNKDIKNLLYSKYSEIIEGADWYPMRIVAPIVRRDVVIDENALYPEVGIRSFGKGTFHKPALTGLEVGTKTLYQVKSGDLLFSNVFAWEGAIAVVKDEDDNRYGSHRFISCEVDKNQAIAEFLCYHFLTPKGLEDINHASPGGAGRNKTLGLEKLMRINVPVPSLQLQKEFVELFHKIETLREHHKQTEKELDKLMPSLLDKAFKGEL